VTAPPDQEQRQQILQQLDRNVLVEAAAGTGKTTGMVGRMVALLRHGQCQRMSEMAAVTFTRKAAAELRGRFRLELERELRQTEPSTAEDGSEQRQRLRQALEQLEQGFVGTIHAFCSRLLRERPVEAGVDLAFEELDEDADRRLRHEAWTEYVEQQLAGQTPGLLEHLDHLGLSLEELRPAFMTCAVYPDVERWPVGDGSLPDLAPVVEQLRANVEHMRTLQPLLPREYGTDTLVPAYHELPRVMRHHEPLDPHHPRQLMQVLEHFKQRMIRYTFWVRTGNFDRQQALQELARWDGMRDVAQRCLQAWQQHRYGPVMQVLQQARGVYDRLRAERGQLSFQDLLLRAAALLRDQPHVRRYFARRYTHLLVDEFQDTDPVQAEVLLLLCAESDTERDWRRCVPRPGSLFVVGDPKQSIYRFRRADIVTYNQVKQVLRDTSGLVLELCTNFRSGVALVGWINETFEQRFPVEVSDESPCYVPLQHGHQAHDTADGAAALPVGLRVLTIAEDASRNNEQTVQEEAGRIARTIRSWLDRGLTVPRTSRELRAGATPRVTPGDIMIVTWRRANLAVYARKLMQLGIGHQVTGGTALNEVPELQLLLLCLEAITRPGDELALVALLRSELFGASDVMLYEHRRAGGRFELDADLPPDLSPHTAELLGTAFDRLRTYRWWLGGMPGMAAIEKLMVDLGLPVRAAARSGGDLDAGSLCKALELLRCAERQSWTLTQLVEYLRLLVEGLEQHDGMRAASSGGLAVRIMNLHKAKGLEAKVVFLADPTGLFDHGVQLHVSRAETIEGYLAVHGPRIGMRMAPLLARPAGWEAIEERERRFLAAEATRLLYVAVTRAGSTLVVTRRARGNQRNPWSPLSPALERVAELEDPGGAARETGERLELEILTPQEVKAARDVLDQQLTLVRRPTQGASPARAFAAWRAGAAPMFIVPGEDTAQEGEHGVEWGAVIHTLLMAAMGDVDADLLPLAQAAVRERGMDPNLAPVAMEAVLSVTGSALWQRARRARRHLTEVPFQVLEPGEPHPTVVRGVIDLVFDEGDGWVVVDYKTDLAAGDLPQLARRHAPQLQLYADAWTRCTREPVKEVGLLLVRDGCHYIPIGSRS